MSRRIAPVELPAGGAGADLLRGGEVVAAASPRPQPQPDEKPTHPKHLPVYLGEYVFRPTAATAASTGGVLAAYAH